MFNKKKKERLISAKIYLKGGDKDYPMNSLTDIVIVDGFVVFIENDGTRLYLNSDIVAYIDAEEYY